MFIIIFINSCLILSSAFSIKDRNLNVESVEKNCTCIPYYQCSDDTGIVISNGEGLIELRNLGTTNSERKCTGYFDVCCQVPTRTVKDDSSTKRNVAFRGCGYDSQQEFPWTGALLYRQTDSAASLKSDELVSSDEYRCGASLIHERAVITAAHCIRLDATLIVKVQNEKYAVKNVVVHPEYEAATLKNDIAVVVLRDAVDMPQNIKTVCLPPPGSVFDRTKCMVNAWQEESDFYWPTGNTLKLPIVPRGRCQKILRATRLGVYFELDQSFMCAGGEEDQDTCRGDGGSPLVCAVPNQPNRFHQVGIVSWGIGCGAQGTPGIYVNVALFRDWIDEVMTKNGLDIISYRY